MNCLDITISGPGGVGLSVAASVISSALKEYGFNINLQDPESKTPKDFEYVKRLVLRDQLNITVNHRPWGG